MTPSRSFALRRAALLLLVAPTAGCGPKVEPRAEAQVEVPAATANGEWRPEAPSAPAAASAPPHHRAGDCARFIPSLIAGHETGYEQCQAGTLHRRAALTCPSLVPRPQQICRPDPPGTTTRGGCTSDADCSQKNEFCGHRFRSACLCLPGCQVDSDCEKGTICQCGEVVGQCVVASCATDADCAPGKLCLSYEGDNPCDFSPRFACQTGADECVSSRDCASEGPGAGAYCGWDGGKRVCRTQSMICGRPCLIDGAPRLARLRRGSWGE